MSRTRTMSPPQLEAIDERSVAESFAYHIAYSVGRDEFNATDRDAFQALALAVRDRLMERWFATQDLVRERRQAGLLPVARVPAGAAAREQHPQSRRRRTLHRDAMRAARARSRGHRRGASATPASATAASAGSPPAFSSRPRRSASRSTATASATSTASSARTSSTASRSRRPTTGCVRQPVGDPAPRRPLSGAVLRARRALQRRGGPRAASAGSTPRTSTRWRTTSPVPGYRNDIVNSLRLWAAKSSREFDLAKFNAGEYVARGRGQEQQREHLEGPLPARRPVTRAASCGSSSSTSSRPRRCRTSSAASTSRRAAPGRSGTRLPEKVAIQLNDTHPAIAIPEMMRVLVDQEAARLGPGLVDLRARLRLHESHGAPRGARERGRRELIGRLLPRHLQIIEEIDRRFRAAVSRRVSRRRARGCARWRSSTTSPATCGWRTSRSSASHAVNGVARLHTEILTSRTFPELPRVLPAEVQQQDERHHAAALAVPGEPGALGAHHRGDRRRVAARPRSPARARAVRRRRGVPRALARSVKRAGKVELASLAPRSRAHRRRSRIAVRRADQADPRVQAAASERHARASRSTIASWTESRCRRRAR